MKVKTKTPLEAAMLHVKLRCFLVVLVFLSPKIAFGLDDQECHDLWREIAQESPPHYQGNLEIFAEEAWQTALMVTFARCKENKKITEPRRYTLTVARRIAVKMIKKENLHYQRFVVDDDMTHTPQVKPSSPEFITFQNELTGEIIDNILEGGPTAIALLHGMTQVLSDRDQKQISYSLGISDRTLRTRYKEFGRQMSDRTSARVYKKFGKRTFNRMPTRAYEKFGLQDPTQRWVDALAEHLETDDALGLSRVCGG